MAKANRDDKRKNIVGPCLRYYRTLNGLSQRDFAAKLQLLGCDIDRNVVSRIESGKRFCTDIDIEGILGYFGITYEELRNCLENGRDDETEKQKDSLESEQIPKEKDDSCIT